MTQVVPELWDPALPSIASYKHANNIKKGDQIWFSKQPSSSKFSSANGEQSTVKERLAIHFRNDHAHTGWITTCVDILDKGKVPILFSAEQMRNLRMNIEHTPVGEFLTCPLFGMRRTALAVSTSNHPVLDIMALATSSWKPMYSFQFEDITCPACNGKHRPHTNKEGCKKFKKPEHAPPEEPKPAKIVPKKNVKKLIQPDSKLEVPSQPFDPFDEPMVASGPSSGSKGGVPRRREPQPEEDMEIKREPKVEVKLEEKKEPSPKGTLSLALRRTHDKLQSPTELLKLHLKHYHMSTEQFKRRTSALKLQKEIYDKFDQITNHATLVPKPRLHPRELRFQEFGRFLVNLLSLDFH